MNTNLKLLTILGLWLVAVNVNSSTLSKNNKLPLHPQLKVSKLKNGFSFATLKTASSKSVVEFRLVVNVGGKSDPKGLYGLAHYIEHMAFNGSKNFPLQSNIASLEKVGVRFGQHFNGSTDFDNTVYSISVSNTESNLDLSLEILRDITTNLTFNPVEFDKERGIIKEEVRLRTQGINARINKQERKFRFPNSTYIEHPVGNLESVDSITVERALNFYREYYIPENMTLIVTGDLSPSHLNQKILNVFSGLESSATNKTQIKPARFLPLENHAVYRDIEDIHESVIISIPLPLNNGSSIKNDRIDTRRNFIISALKERLSEVVVNNSLIFKTANAGIQNRNDNSPWLYISAKVNNEKTASATSLLYRTFLNFHEFGLTELEFSRIQKRKLIQLEQFLASKESISSSRWAQEIQSYLLENGSMMSVEQAYAHDIHYLNQLALADIDSQLKQIDIGNVFIEIVSNDDDLSVKKVYKKIKQLKPSMNGPKLPKGNAPVFFEEETLLSEVVSENFNKALSSWEWTLPNGIKVVAKKHNLEPGKVFITGISPNGFGGLNDSDYFNAKAMLGVKGRSQVKGVPAQQYNQYMNTQNIEVSQQIQRDLSKVHVKGGNDNIENLLKSILLQFTSGSFDAPKLTILKNMLAQEYKKNINSVESQFNYDLNDLLYESHRSITPWNDSSLDLLNIKTMSSIYNRLFNNANGYTFFITGDFNPKEIRNLVSGVFSRLPIFSSNAINNNKRIKHILGEHNLIVKRENDNKAVVKLHYYTKQIDKKSKYNIRLNAWASEIVRLKLMDKLREEHGLTYDVHLASNTNIVGEVYTENTISIFGISDNVSKIIDITNAEIKNLKENIISEDILESLIAKKLRDYRENKKGIYYWNNVLIDFYMWGYASEDILMPEIDIKRLTEEELKNGINKFFNDKNRIKAVLSSNESINPLEKAAS